MMFCFCACNCTEKNEGTSGGGNSDKVETVKDVTAYVTTSDMKTLFKKSSFSFTDTHISDSRGNRNAARADSAGRTGASNGTGSGGNFCAGSSLRNVSQSP